MLNFWFPPPSEISVSKKTSLCSFLFIEVEVICNDAFFFFAFIFISWRLITL